MKYSTIVYMVPIIETTNDDCYHKTFVPFVLVLEKREFKFYIVINPLIEILERKLRCNTMCLVGLCITKLIQCIPKDFHRADQYIHILNNAYI